LKGRAFAQHEPKTRGRKGGRRRNRDGDEGCIVEKKRQSPNLKLTVSPLQMDGWKMKLPSGTAKGLFSGANY